MKNRLEKTRAVPKREAGDARFSNHYLDTLIISILRADLKSKLRKKPMQRQ